MTAPYLVLMMGIESLYIITKRPETEKLPFQQVNPLIFLLENENAIYGRGRI
jgi:hypothetical protein